MFFRNLSLFRFPDVGGYDREILESCLTECALKPVGPLELSSRGFVAPMGRDNTALHHRNGDFVWIAVGGEDKILPTAAVNAELAKWLEALERTEGRKPGGRTRKRLRDDVVHELLPRALVRPSRIDCYLDLARGLVVVDTPSRKRAESVVSEIRHALGSFPALPLNAEVAPRAVLTGWLAGEPLPEGLTLGDCATLKDAADRGASVKLTHQELQSGEVARHLEAGKQCTRLGMALDDCVAFTVDEDLQLRAVRFLDGAVEALESIERDDLHAELDARFCLMTGQLGRLFDALFPALHISGREG